MHRIGHDVPHLSATQFPPVEALQDLHLEDSATGPSFAQVSINCENDISLCYTGINKYFYYFYLFIIFLNINHILMIFRCYVKVSARDRCFHH